MSVCRHLAGALAERYHHFRDVLVTSKQLQKDLGMEFVDGEWIIDKEAPPRHSLARMPRSHTPPGTLLPAFNSRLAQEDPLLFFVIFF